MVARAAFESQQYDLRAAWFLNMLPLFLARCANWIGALRSFLTTEDNTLYGRNACCQSGGTPEVDPKNFLNVLGIEE